MSLRPIFLFSLPRSGSTLAQRTLSTHERIATVSEPWILLPYLYTLRPHGAYAEYWHNTASVAIEDFCQALPNKHDDYLSEIREFVLRLYSKAASDGSRYFLDKTPRYHLVVKDIINLFPDGKFVFLWRNPLAVVASVMETWAKGNWNLYKFKVDLFSGLENIVDAYQRHQAQAHAVRYEDLLTDPTKEWTKLFEYLELSFDHSILQYFNRITLRGRMGDPTGTRRYSHVSLEPLKKWERTLANPVRKAWCRRYLYWIGAKRLAAMGYELDGLLAQLDSIPMSAQRLGSDIARISYGFAHQVLEPPILKQKLRLATDWHRVHSLQ